MTFYVIGIGNKAPKFTVIQQELIRETKYFSGGKRHLTWVKPFLPKDFKWIPIASPMQSVFDAYEKIEVPVIIFASGNPLFYGFSNTLKNKYPKAIIYTAPYFSSIQLLTNKTNTNSNELVTVSVHGRPWKALDSALIKQLPLIGVLTDGLKNPKTIAERLLRYGCDNYKITIGEDLEGKNELIQTISLKEAVTKKYHTLNCILLHKVTDSKQQFGIKDTDFIGLEGRPNMITKMPIRLTTLHLLDVLQIKTLWDIGFCTGSISIEAKLKNPDLEIIAFEKREVCETILLKNQQQFGVPGIEMVIGDFFEQDIIKYTKPEAVFIGGHGGRLKELLQLLDNQIALGTRIVINAVQEKSKTVFIESCKNMGWSITQDLNISLDLHNPIRLLKAVKN
ncbi:hypothetical protein A8C32_08205 [Flavivirga aquatica]|uniref:Cytochrome D ubiquinol oxidase subunit II n=1 Tax=Flavivirga aquatica TaxID=1849968 RepID=A0A1E5SJB3_9FLAO|nr:bifunctional cobalt-precorrin-7 (C(5))-methyltransferase/cobalt-precorrin-6B (C(15))-methyltransferase [Flavivirga aquatica]OEJ99146.1 hypothetical protein A8C32_08205 [Flavivirga aquatica]